MKPKKGVVPESRPAKTESELGYEELKSIIGAAIQAIEQEHLHLEELKDLHRRMHEEENYIYSELDKRLPELRKLSEKVEEIKKRIAQGFKLEVRKLAEDLIEKTKSSLRALETIQDRLHALESQFKSATKKYLGEWQQIRAVDEALHKLANAELKWAKALEEEGIVTAKIRK